MVPRSVFPVVLLLLLAGPGFGDSSEAEVDVIVQKAMKAWQVPGASVAIVQGGKVFYLKGHGLRDIDGDQHVDPDTIFPMASCTKAFTTTSLAILADRGKLSLEDHPRKYVPFFRLSDPISDAQVMIRDLLCHRTGLDGHDFLWYHSPWSPREAVEKIGFVKVGHPIRSHFQYQSTMFTAAGFVVAEAGKKPWDRFVQQEIFEPLGMKRSSCSTIALEKETNKAVGHRVNARGALSPLKEWYALKVPDAAGSINSTARDLSSWLLLHLNEGEHEGKRIVSEKQLSETHSPQMVIPFDKETQRMHPETQLMSYGMGWVVQDYRGTKLVSHAGAIDGFKAHLTLIPKAKVGIAILANRHQTRFNLALSYTLVDHLLGLEVKRDWHRYLQKVVEDRQKKKAEAHQKRLARRHFGTKPSHGLARYQGSYVHPAYGTCRVTLERGKLLWRWSTFRCAMEHFHYDTFVVRDPVFDAMLLNFQTDTMGKVGSYQTEGPLKVTFRRKE